MVVKGEFDATDIEEAKLEIIQGMDSPIAPGSQAETAYSWWRRGAHLIFAKHFAIGC